MQTTVDIVVIGGGVNGAATAYELAKAGLQVALLEKNTLASGTSGRCDGNVMICDKAPGYDMAISKASLDLFPLLAAELDYDIEWRQKGSLLAMVNEQEMEMAKQFLSGISHYPMRLLDKAQTLASEPMLNPNIVGGLETDCDGAMNPMALVYGLAQGLEKLGGKVYTETEVTGFKLNSQNKLESVFTTVTEFKTKAVVICAGIWTRQLGQMLNLDIPISPRQGQILVGEKSKYIARRKVMEFGYLAAKFADGEYTRDVTPEMEEFGIALVFEPTGAGNFLIGSSRAFCGEDTSSNPRILRAMAQRALRFFPCLRDVKIIRSYAGLRPFTPDHLPIVSGTPLGGVYIGSGHEGDGIGMSLITAKLLREIITNTVSSYDSQPLSFQRFSKQANAASPF